VLLAALPESIRFLLLKGGQEARVASLLRKVAPKAPAAAAFAPVEDCKPGFPVSQLFTERRARTTLLLWIIFFMSLLDLYFLNSWLPTVIHDAGVPLAQAITITALFQVGGAAAAIVLGRIVDRQMSYGVLAWVYLGAAICVFLIGLVNGTVAIGVVVTSKGMPDNPQVVKSLDKEVDSCAVEAVKQWRFAPAQKQGKPVAVHITVEIEFHSM